MGNYPLRVEPAPTCTCQICRHKIKQSYDWYSEEHIICVGNLILSNMLQSRRNVLQQLYSNLDATKLAKLVYEAHNGDWKKEPTQGLVTLTEFAAEKVRTIKYRHLIKSERIGIVIQRTTPLPRPPNKHIMRRQNQTTMNITGKAGRKLLMRPSGR